MKWMALILVCALANVVRAERHTGVGFVGLWDFSEAGPRRSLDDPWDFGSIITLKTSPLDLFMSANYDQGAAIAVMPAGVEFDDVTEAPEPDAEYSGWPPWVMNRVWICRTVEGNFAKLWSLNQQGPWEFMYVYQDDGSRDVSTPTPVAATTWGGIKALYE